MSSESLVVMLLSFIKCIIYNSNTAQYYGGGGVGIGLVKAVGSADVCNYIYIAILFSIMAEEG